MKKRTTNNNQEVSGYYVNDVEHGFWGENGEGIYILKEMGLPTNEVPFSIAIFLKKKEIIWFDSQKRRAKISFKLKDDIMEFYGCYRGKRKTTRLYREWGEYEDPEKIKRLESEAIGNMCALCIYDKLIEKKQNG